MNCQFRSCYLPPRVGSWQLPQAGTDDKHNCMASIAVTAAAASCQYESAAAYTDLVWHSEDLLCKLHGVAFSWRFGVLLNFTKVCCSKFLLLATGCL